MSGFVRCVTGEVEDMEHFLLHCTGLVEERMQMERLMKETVEMEGKEKVVWVVDQACENGRV